MSSAVRQLAQVQTSTGFFLAIANTVEYVPTNGNTFSAVMGQAAFLAAAPAASASVLGRIYKDLGKTVTTINGDGQHLAKFRLVQEMDSAADEGVPTTGASYICTWTADSISGSYPTPPVTVARTG